MTTIKHRIATLQTRNPNAQVYLMTQRKQPFENHLAGVVGREEMADQAWRIESGIALWPCEMRRTNSSLSSSCFISATSSRRVLCEL